MVENGLAETYMHRQAPENAITVESSMGVIQLVNVTVLYIHCMLN